MRHDAEADVRATWTGTGAEEERLRMRARGVADDRETARIVENALDRIVAGYVFPERTAEIAASIRGRLAAGRMTHWTARSSARR
ncbi:hypothetical protein [Streptomyces noursei]|uniref:hypothetical protein n=1 Tax=Streptomyces noursei TaxID=1971 RepID=UPI001F047D57|nr:hypothetical protein [Streptomyces noursei]